MISKYTYNGVTWMDLQSPSKEEIFHLIDEYSLPTLLAEEFISETVRSKVDVYNNIIYLVLHFPITRKNSTRTEQEVDFVVGKDFLITIHYELVNPLHDFFKKFEVRALLDQKTSPFHAGYLFYHIIKELYKNVMTDIEDVSVDLRRIEKDIFEGKEKETVKVISDVNRKILDFKQSMRFHYETLKSFESGGKKFFEPTFAYYLESIIGEYNKIKNAIDTEKEILTELRETNDSLLSTKTNETIKILTIITFIVVPLNIIMGIFTMSTDFILIKTYSDFAIVLGSMFATSVITFIFFKIKKWL